MSLAQVNTRAQLGILAPKVTVEVHVANGLPSFSIVGLPETAVKESRERVRSALLNNGFEFPPRRVTVNLAPADLPKEGGRFDLAIAIGLLVASEQIPSEKLKNTEFIGELALSGELRNVTGILPSALGLDNDILLVVPQANLDEALLARPENTFGAGHLNQVCAYLKGQEELPSQRSEKCTPPAQPAYTDLTEVKGQAHAKRALEIAAAGGHSLMFVGPPGTGKSLLASCLPGLLPEMTHQEKLESAAILSVAQGFDAKDWGKRNVRCPHHTASSVALVGGGPKAKPGEISLAHHSILFLDEFPEFDRRVLEVLREPLESGRINISRAAVQAEYPANFQLIAAMNPCPCGYLGDKDIACRDSAAQIARYQSKISGPILDRIDMQVHVGRIPPQDLFEEASGETSATVRMRVETARNQQLSRQERLNHQLKTSALEKHCKLSDPLTAFLSQAMNRLKFSNRATHRILRVARTIADLDNSPQIKQHHLIEAIGYRTLELSSASQNTAMA